MGIFVYSSEIECLWVWGTVLAFVCSIDRERLCVCVWERVSECERLRGWERENICVKERACVW